MSFSITDTIVAIATPPGRGGIGVVRLSGPAAAAIAGRLITHRTPLEPRRAIFTRLRSVDRAELRRAGQGSFDCAELRHSSSEFQDSDATHMADGDGTASAVTIDQAVVTFFPAPHSYTGEDVVELSAHGSPVVLRTIVASAVNVGARLALPGEFTLRAFLNGRIDLAQAEAVADLIDAVTPLQARAAFDQLEGTLTRTIGELDAALFDLIARLEASVDFPEEGYHFVAPGELANAIDTLSCRTASLLAEARRGRLIREGSQVAIVGPPNVGKSSLFNALAGASRAIVADVAGTTRDLVTEVIDLDGLRVTLIDTAGLRDSTDAVEAEGVARSRQAQTVADLVVHVVVDPIGQHPSSYATTLLDSAKNFIVQNKIDLMGPRCPVADAHVSATTGEGVDALRAAIVNALSSADAGRAEPLRERPEITNVRHITLVQRAHDALLRARHAAGAAAGALPEEFVLADLQDARAALEEIAGRRTPDDLLEHIFARFCVGK